jgi:MoxR-like ATPase
MRPRYPTQRANTNAKAMRCCKMRSLGRANDTGSLVNTSPDLSEFKVAFDRAVDHIGTVVRGKRDVVRTAFVCLLARGHLLIEDVPGVAKTSLAKAIARAIGGTVGRVQFTPDLLPSDLLGVDVFNQRTLEFEFREGPLFANVVLGDEINRASPKTQSALLEAMAEGQITVGRTRHSTPQPFLCIATQNPIEQYGTFPLPEAQLDRFMMRISIGYPAPSDEVGIIIDPASRVPRIPQEPVLTLAKVTDMMRTVEQVTVKDTLAEYIVRLAATTRDEAGARRAIRLGVSPRGTVALTAAAQALAASYGRSYATVDDVKEMAVPVLSHRLILAPSSVDGRRSQAEVITEILRVVRAPGT